MTRILARADGRWVLTVDGTVTGHHEPFSPDTNSDLEQAAAWAEGVLGATELLPWRHRMADRIRRIEHWEV